MSKNLQVSDQATLVNFFGNENFFISQKISSVGSSEFQKELQVLDQPNFFDIF